MERRTVTAAVLLCTVCLAGCPAAPTARTDPGSDAADLSGRWCLMGGEQGFFGFFELDDTGDPTTLEDNPTALDELGVDTLILDGKSHSTDRGLQYTGIASAKLDGVDVELFVELRFFGFGFEVGALALKFEGERVTADKLEGVAVTLQDFVDRDVPEMIIQTGTATKNQCE